jgi:hypothetical protein
MVEDLTVRGVFHNSTLRTNGPPNGPEVERPVALVSDDRAANGLSTRNEGDDSERIEEHNEKGECRNECVCSDGESI